MHSTIKEKQDSSSIITSLLFNKTIIETMRLQTYFRDIDVYLIYTLSTLSDRIFERKNARSLKEFVNSSSQNAFLLSTSLSLTWTFLISAYDPFSSPSAYAGMGV